MAVVRLRAPLSELVGGRREIPVPGATVGDVLVALERDNPAVAGWILDERRRIRVHVNVFVNARRADEGTAVADADLVHVLPSISGGER